MTAECPDCVAAKAAIRAAAKGTATKVTIRRGDDGVRHTHLRTEATS